MTNETKQVKQETPAAEEFKPPFKAEVIADSSGKWCGNQLTFETKEAAREYVVDLTWRWTSVRAWRTVDSEGREVERS